MKTLLSESAHHPIVAKFTWRTVLPSLEPAFSNHLFKFVLSRAFCDFEILLYAFSFFFTSKLKLRKVTVSVVDHKKVT
jgi:hypothetical protein